MGRIEDGALQRAIEGAERPIVSAGKLLGTYRVHNEALVMFLLRQRRPQRYATIPQVALRPGHPLYEKIKREVIDEYEGDEEEVRDSIVTFLEDMRERRLANEKLLAELDAEEAGNDLDAPLVDDSSQSETDMTDRQEKRGEQSIDERDPETEREPQEGSRRNNAQSVDKEGRDANRDGSESDKD